MRVTFKDEVQGLKRIKDCSCIYCGHNIDNHSYKGCKVWRCKCELMSSDVIATNNRYEVILNIRRANATSGEYSGQIVPDLTGMDALKRW